MTKSERRYQLLKEGSGRDNMLFHHILMHFTARFHGKTYSEFATDYRVLVESNIWCLEYFDYDAVSVISDPYHETAAFGAKVEFPRDAVPLCKDRIIKTIEDIKSLKNPDVCVSKRTSDRIRGVEYYKKLPGNEVPIIGWIEGPMAEPCDLAGDSEILMRVIMEPNFASFLLEKCLKTAKDFALAQIEAGATVMGVGDAPALRYLCYTMKNSFFHCIVNFSISFAHSAHWSSFIYAATLRIFYRSLGKQVLILLISGLWSPDNAAVINPGICYISFHSTLRRITNPVERT